MCGENNKTGAQLYVSHLKLNSLTEWIFIIVLLFGWIKDLYDSTAGGRLRNLIFAVILFIRLTVSCFHCYVLHTAVCCVKEGNFFSFSSFHACRLTFFSVFCEYYICCVEMMMMVMLTYFYPDLLSFFTRDSVWCLNCKYLIKPTNENKKAQLEWKIYVYETVRWECDVTPEWQNRKIYLEFIHIHPINILLMVDN